MGFWRTIFAIARRRVVGPPIILLALVAGGLAFYFTPAHYVSSGFMVLTTPTAGGVVDPTRPNWTTNPLLQFNDGLKTTAAILIQQLNTPEEQARMGAPEGGPTKITVNDGSSAPKVMQSSVTGPFIYVEVDSTSPAGVRDTVLRVEQELRSNLDARQRQLRAPASTYLSLSDVVTPTDPVRKIGTKWEYAGAAVALVLVAGFGIAYGFDRRAAGRRQAPTAPVPYGDLGGPAPRPALGGGGARAQRPALDTGGRGLPLVAAPVDPPPRAAARSGHAGWDPEETREFRIVFEDDEERPRARSRESSSTRDVPRTSTAGRALPAADDDLEEDLVKDVRAWSSTEFEETREWSLREFDEAQRRAAEPQRRAAEPQRRTGEGRLRADDPDQRDARDRPVFGGSEQRSRPFKVLGSGPAPGTGSDHSSTAGGGAAPRQAPADRPDDREPGRPRQKPSDDRPDDNDGRAGDVAAPRAG